MKAKFGDVHGAHGLTFELEIEADHVSGDQFHDFKCMLVELGGDKTRSLYTRTIALLGNRIVFGLTEGRMHTAKVDHMWNGDRVDQKFGVLVINLLQEWGWDVCPHFKCHWCKQETWGVTRVTTEVYDHNTEKMTLVSVHRECQDKRDKQIARVPFEA